MFKTVGLLFGIYVLTYVEGLLFTWAINPLDNTTYRAVVLVEGIIMSTVRFGLLIAIGSMIPQPWVKIVSITVLAIFYVNSILSTLDIFNLYSVFSKPIDYFQF